MKYLRYFEEHKPNPPDVIVDSYLEAALWTSNDREEFDNKTIWNFSDKAKKQAKKDIEWFLNNAGSVFDDVDETTIGYDLWLSRNGHGSGFFDRDGYDEDDSKFLMDLSKILGEISIYINDRGWIDFDIYSEKYKNFDLEKYFKDKEEKDRIKKYNL